MDKHSQERDRLQQRRHSYKGTLLDRSLTEEERQAVENKIASLDQQIKDQEAKMWAATERGMTGAPLRMMDQKLARLESERDDLSDHMRFGDA